MTTITVNGQRIELDTSVSEVRISGDSVFVGGRAVVSGLSGIVEVRWQGPLASLEADAPVTVNGDVQGDVSAGSSVTARKVQGSVRAGGSVHCGDVQGGVQAGGSVCCGRVGGGVPARQSVYPEAAK